MYVHNTDPIAQYQRSIGIAEIHSSVSAYESMYWSMQFTHIRNKTGPFLVYCVSCAACLISFPQHLPIT